MMIAGCFGLLAATADVMPELAETIYGSLKASADAASRRGIIHHKGVEYESASSYHYIGCAGFQEVV